MRITRSPAERYIKFLILRARMDNFSIRRELERRRLVPVGSRFLDELRDRLRPPEPFHPWQLDHQASQSFLEREGIETLFRRAPVAGDALRIAEQPRLQEVVEVLLLAGASPEMVAAGLEARTGAHVTAGVVAAYRSLCFDLSLFDRSEVRHLMRRRLGRNVDPDIVRSDARATAASLPVGAVNGVLASLRMGALPRHIDYRRLAESARGVLAARVLEAAVGGTRKDATAALHFAGALRVVHELVEGTADPNGAVLEAVQHMQIVSDTSRLPTVRELSGGRHTVDLLPLGPEAETADASQDCNTLAIPEA